MGIFNIFSSKSLTNEHTDKDSSGLIVSTGCPYCNVKLIKIPGRKKKCESCGEFIYVRTRPGYLKRALVTKEQADKIDEEWSIINGTHDYYISQKHEYDEAKEALKKRFGRDPSENDIKWLILNKRISSGTEYRNTRYDMAEILRKEGKLKQALEYYLEVCYLDLNEAQKLDYKNLSEYLAPAVVYGAKKMLNKLNLNKDEAGQVFSIRINKIKSALKIPLSVDKAWDSMKEIFF